MAKKEKRKFKAGDLVKIKPKSDPCWNARIGLVKYSLTEWTLHMACKKPFKLKRHRFKDPNSGWFEGTDNLGFHESLLVRCKPRRPMPVKRRWTNKCGGFNDHVARIGLNGRLVKGSGFLCRCERDALKAVRVLNKLERKLERKLEARG